MNRSDPIQPILQFFGANDKLQLSYGQWPFDAAMRSFGLVNLLWYAARVGLRRECIALACDFAEHRRCVSWSDDHPAVVAVETARKWLRGEATESQCRSAAKAVYAASPADAALYVAYYAAEAASRGDAFHAAGAARLCAERHAATLGELHWQIERAHSVLTPDVLWDATVKTIQP